MKLMENNDPTSFVYRFQNIGQSLLKCPNLVNSDYSDYVR